MTLNGDTSIVCAFIENTLIFANEDWGFEKDELSNVSVNYSKGRSLQVQERYGRDG